LKAISSGNFLDKNKMGNQVSSPPDAPSAIQEDHSSTHKASAEDKPKKSTSDLTPSLSEVKPNLFASSFQQEEAAKQPVLTEQVLRDAASEAIELIKKFTYTDPLMELTEYYQKRGHTTSLSDAFTHVSDGPNRAKPYWRCTFKCPIGGEETSSSLPLPLIHGGQSNNDDLAELSDRFFGPHKIVNGLVFFKTKKGAKKSAAMAMLMLKTEQDNSTLNNVLVESKDEASLILLQSPKQDALVEPQKAPKTRRLPSWVHELNKVGIEKVRITYQERLKDDGAWRGKPTDLCCIMSISKPIETSVIGLPYPSKQDARQSAVALLVEKIGRLDPLSVEEENGTVPDDKSIYRKKHDLFTCDVQMGKYVSPVPQWARRAISPQADGSKGYLYELVILTKSERPVACDKLLVVQSEAARIGIIFPENCGPTKVTGYSTHFCFQSGSGEYFTAKLESRTVVDLDDFLQNEDSKKSGLMSIQRFNRIIAMWKTYGIGGDLGQPISTESPFLSQCDTSQFARTYMFVPLQGGSDKSTLKIDWDMLKLVSSTATTRYLIPRKLNMELPVLGKADLGHSLSAIAVAVGLGMLLNETRRESRFSLPRHDIPHIWMTGLLCFLLMVVSLYIYLLPPRKSLSDAQMRNRFLLCRLPRPEVYIALENPSRPLTAGSKYRSERNHATIKQHTVEYFQREFNLNILKASFVDFYKKRFGIQIQHPRSKLVAAHKVQKHSDFNPFMSTLRSSRINLIIPELIEILPIPRDMIYVLSLADRFMPALEREIELAISAQRLLEMGMKTQYMLRNASLRAIVPSSNRLSFEHRQTPFSILLCEATTTFPSITFQRLEFLGDSVLGFFVALNTFSRNSSLAWDYEDLGNIDQAAVKNVALHGGSLRAGLSRLIHARPIPWRSPYGPAEMHKKKRKTSLDPFLEKSIFGYTNEGQVIEIGDSILSDIVESVLAAVYLHGMGDADDSTGGRMTVAVLELLSLPFPNEDETDAISWFRAHGPCLKGGYPFQLDIPWQEQLIKIGTILYCNEGIIKRLEAGYESLLDKLGNLASDGIITGCLLQERSKILLLAALFDDNLDGTNCGAQELEGLCSVALMRDTLFHVGAYALQLMITEEAFRIFPMATENDLHLLRACALTDDITVYVMVKAAFDDSLFDSKADSRKKFRQAAAAADKKGVAFWEARGGWTVKGGVDEFNRRRAHYFPKTSRGQESSSPLYAGLAGGRLHGCRTKVGDSLTGDLQFSFKAIIGALVLSLGTEAMWCCIGPLFEETLLLSADELRAEYSDTSSICSSSNIAKKGGIKKKSNNQKKLKYGVLD
jgi:dsRNA-specific ribonuclease